MPLREGCHVQPLVVERNACACAYAHIWAYRWLSIGWKITEIGRFQSNATFFIFVLFLSELLIDFWNIFYVSLGIIRRFYGIFGNFGFWFKIDNPCGTKIIQDHCSYAGSRLSVVFTTYVSLYLSISISVFRVLDICHLNDEKNLRALCIRQEDQSGFWIESKFS